MDHATFLMILNGLLDAAPPEDAARVARDEALHGTSTWSIFQPLLITHRDVLHVERKSIAQAPHTASLAVAGATHDAFGRTFWLSTGAVLEDPGASAEDKAAAALVRSTFLPSLQEINLSTAAEIENARLRAPKVDAHGPSLDRIPAAGGRTARHLVQGMIDTAAERARWVTERATQTRPPAPPASALQVAIGVFFDFRNTLVREIQAKPALPRDLEAQVFGLFDRHWGA